ncbi:hypothetical protein GH714_029892 [Hevea brasiliensis]|uniref:K-box domain-containing protein n=1 Tax=Hevea brasiliensis TaxID=3981 RepID=A0A6A6KWI4_HEVBR|nr:hypothetical protein GH714_029892 [Hevea brasiliensis]
MANFLKEYQRHLEVEAASVKGAMIQRQLEGPTCEQLSVTDLIKLENQFAAALTQIRAKKTELMLDFIKALHNKEIMLKEDNVHLEREMEAMKNGVGMVKRLRTHPNLHLVHSPQQATLSLLQ